MKKAKNAFGIHDLVFCEVNPFKKYIKFWKKNSNVEDFIHFEFDN
jgi:hypothetical protein